MFVRSYNPIWSFVDLVGNQLDDMYYMFVLENTIPYIPTPVYMSPDPTSSPWADPIQFLANGTLPDNIYWDPGPADNPNVYRIEIRKGNTQADPLIYLIENYVPSTEGGGNPPTDIAFTTDNQISNPQFSIVNFTSPYTFTSVSASTVQIAPGWFIVLGSPVGTGSITLNQVSLNNTSINPTNASYALEIQTSGWSKVTLVQRFEQNGMLWTSNGNTENYLSLSMTAQTSGAIGNITAQMVDSQANILGTFTNFNNVAISNGWNEYTGHLLMPSTTNSDFPPPAYIELELTLQTNITFFLTSLQIVVSNMEFDISYEEDTIARQQDHLFHFYNPLLQYKPIPSLLTAWDFPLNPAQFGSSKTISTTADYIWDQTIAACSSSTMAVARSAVTNGISVTSSAANQAFYFLQYLEDSQALETTLTDLSTNINAIVSSGEVVVNVQMFYSTTNGTIPTLPTSLGNITVSGTNIPVFTLTASGWTAISQENGFSNNGLFPATTLTDLQFLNFLSSANYDSGSSTQNFAIVVAFLVKNNPSTITINSISATPGSIATRPSPQTIDEVLRECQYYYETSYPYGIAAGTNTSTNIYITQLPGQMYYDVYQTSGGINKQYTAIHNTNFNIKYNTVKRITACNVVLYNSTGTANMVGVFGTENAVTVLNTALASSLWTSTIGDKSAGFVVVTPNSKLYDNQQSSSNPASITQSYIQGYISYHVEIDARLGKF